MVLGKLVSTGSGRGLSGDGCTDTYSNHEHIAVLCICRGASQLGDNGRLGKGWTLEE